MIDWLVNEMKQLKEDNFALREQLEFQSDKLAEYDKAIKGKLFQPELSSIEQMHNQFKDIRDELIYHVLASIFHSMNYTTLIVNDTSERPSFFQLRTVFMVSLLSEVIMETRHMGLERLLNSLT